MSSCSLPSEPPLPQWLKHQRICLHYRRPGIDPWVKKIPWRRKWQPIPVFLPGESHGQRSLVGYSPWGHKELDTTEWLTLPPFILLYPTVHTATVTWKASEELTHFQGAFWPCLVKRGTGTPLWLTMMGGYRNSWPWRSHFQQGPPAPMKHIPVLCPIPCAPQSREIEFRRSPQMRGSDLVCTTSEHRVTIWVAGAQSSIKVWECGMWNELILLLTRSLSNWDSLAQSRHSVHLLMIIAQVPRTFLYPRNTKMFGQWKQ